MSAAGTLATRVCRFVLCASLAACGQGADRGTREPAVLVIGADTVVLESGARIIDIDLAAGPGRVEFEPALVDAAPGDVLRFTAQDGGPHAIVFDERSTGTRARSFLAGTDQLRGLPLLERGAVWIVSLAGAPAGVYVARCLTHDGEARIRLPTTGRRP